MPIPGMKPQFDVLSKVRVGEKRTSGNGRQFPAALDYFKADDDLDFDTAAGAQPKQLRIRFPYETPEENFGTGLEMWRGRMLACYTKGEGNPPIAYRRRTIRQNGQDVDLIGDAEVRGEPMGNDRLPITCGFRECPFFKSKECRPMGRLVFFLTGVTAPGVYQFETKGWNTIEELTKALQAAYTRKPDLRGRDFVLSVAIVGQGQKKFPLVTLEEVNVPVDCNSEASVSLADAYVQACKARELAIQAVNEGHHVEAVESDVIRPALAALLDVYRPGWRQDQAYIDRIREVGVSAAWKATLERVAQEVQ